MVGSLNPSRRKVLVAVVVSVALHSLLSLVWLTARGHARLGSERQS